MFKQACCCCAKFACSQTSWLLCKDCMAWPRLETMPHESHHDHPRTYHMKHWTLWGADTYAGWIIMNLWMHGSSQVRLSNIATLLLFTSGGRSCSVLTASRTCTYSSIRLTSMYHPSTESSMLPTVLYDCNPAVTQMHHHMYKYQDYWHLPEMKRLACLKPTLNNQTQIPTMIRSF